VTVSWRHCLVALLLVPACAGDGANARSGDAGYQEYECSAPIGKIVREDCSKVALRYEGVSISGDLGVGPVEASGSFTEQALRQADDLVALLKEQRVALCNDFNTCKLTVSEYRAERQASDDSYVAVLTLKDKLKQLDAQSAMQLLAEIQKIRRGATTKAEPAPAAPSDAPGLSAVRFAVKALDRGQYVDGTLDFNIKSPGPARVEGTSDTDGYGFDFVVEDPRSGHAGLFVGCYADRGPHVVRWTFALRDQRGVKSNDVVVPIECTGRAPSGLTVSEVNVEKTDVALGASTAGTVRFAGPGRYPLQLHAWGDKPGHGFDWKVDDPAVVQSGFTLSCYADRGQYDVTWTFNASDAQGLHSNPVSVTIHCR